MRPGFEKTLREYSEIITTDTLPEDEEEFKRIIEALSADSQEEIYEIQERKQEIMGQLHEDLRNIDDSEYQPKVPKGGHKVMYKKSRGGFYVFLREEKRREVLSLGDIMTDFTWEQGYNLVLDPETVPRQVRKRFVVERAKNQLRGLLDEQILTDELAREEVHPMRKKAYEAIRERTEETYPPGVIAEKMVQNILTKLSLDIEGIDLKVLPADVYQDVAEKVDFIVKRQQRKRGVRIEGDESEDAQVIGIQFTTDMSKRGLEKKERQIAKARERLGETDLEDIVLVRIPVHKVMAIYKKWQRKKTHGGPEKLMSRGMQAEIFEAVMKGFLSEEEIRQHCAKVKHLETSEEAPVKAVDQRVDDQQRLGKLRTQLANI